MALIRCWECDEEVSDRAESCPHCGAPRKLKFHEKLNRFGRGTSRTGLKITAYTWGALILIILLYVLFV